MPEHDTQADNKPEQAGLMKSTKNPEYKREMTSSEMQSSIEFLIMDNSRLQKRVYELEEKFYRHKHDGNGDLIQKIQRY